MRGRLVGRRAHRDSLEVVVHPDSQGALDIVLQMFEKKRGNTALMLLGNVSRRTMAASNYKGSAPRAANAACYARARIQVNFKAAEIGSR